MKSGKVDVILGLQWGDEGKGKVTDVLTPYYDIICRFQGGPNAGHTLVFEGKRIVLHTIPSGIFNPGKINVIGNGVIIDPINLMNEIRTIETHGINVPEALLVARKSPLSLPVHRVLDSIYEAIKGKAQIGTTGRGIGPTYTDATARRGLRIGDINDSGFRMKYDELTSLHLKEITGLGFNIQDLRIDNYTFDEYEATWFESIDQLAKQLQLIDCESYINNAVNNGKNVLCEGAQGTMLDVTYGTVPFVTSSCTISAGVCTGLGISPHMICDVYGVLKAYTTRVGSGPFPTEIFDQIGEKIRKIGHERGATTGRDRRCGWPDLVALRYAVMLNGVTKLIMTKCDVLSGFNSIKICTAYKLNDGGITCDFPYNSECIVEPILEELPCWNTDLTGMTCEDELPQELKNYISFIEEYLGGKVTINTISVGEDRRQIIPLVG